MIYLPFLIKDHNLLLNTLNDKQNYGTLSLFESYIASSCEREILTTRHQSEVKLSKRRAGLTKKIVPSKDLTHKSTNSLPTENGKLLIKKSSGKNGKLFPDYKYFKTTRPSSPTARTHGMLLNTPRTSLKGRQLSITSRNSQRLIDVNTISKNFETDIPNGSIVRVDDNDHRRILNTKTREKDLINKDVIKERLAHVFKEIDSKVNEPRKKVGLKMRIGNSIISLEDTECLSPAKSKISKTSTSSKIFEPTVTSMIQSSLLDDYGIMSKGIAFTEIIKKRLEQKQKEIKVAKERRPQPFIPDWLKKNQDYTNNYKNTKFNLKNEISDLIAKKKESRTFQDNQEIADWLVKFDLFSNLNYHTLLDLGLSLYLKVLKKGDILCHNEEAANSLYIIFEGELEIQKNGNFQGISKAGEYIGRAALDKDGLKRSATLKAIKETKVFCLDKNDYRNIVSTEIDTKMADRYGFITNFPFYRYFNDHKLKIFCKQLKYRKVYKNEIIFDFGQQGEEMYIMHEGEINRQIKLKTDKYNKWPTSLRSWQVSTIVKSFIVELPIEPGQLFGGKEMIYTGERKEKIVAVQDSSVFYMGRENFLASK